MLEGLETIKESEINHFCQRFLTSMLHEIVLNYTKIIHSPKRTSIEEGELTVRPPFLKLRYN